MGDLRSSRGMRVRTVIFTEICNVLPKEKPIRLNGDDDRINPFTLSNCKSSMMVHES